MHPPRPSSNVRCFWYFALLPAPPKNRVVWSRETAHRCCSAHKTMTDLFLPLLLAFLTSFLGIIVLAFSTFGFCFMYVFKPLIICVCTSYFYGAFFLPVCLQLCAFLGLIPTFGATAEQTRNNSTGIKKPSPKKVAPEEESPKHEAKEAKDS